MQQQINKILQAYSISNVVTITTITTGLINKTYKVDTLQNSYILQQINTKVFTTVNALNHNFTLITTYKNKELPNYLLPLPILTTSGTVHLKTANNEYWRVIPYVPASITYSVLTSPQQAYEAAYQFGLYTANFVGMNTQQLQCTILNFHNLTLRYQQYVQATKLGNTLRVNACTELIAYLQSQYYIVKKYEQILTNPKWQLRLTHHDCKISNVLFADEFCLLPKSETTKAPNALCVIDLDTTMPGYYISDVGDMLRTYLSPVTENEANYSKIIIREDYYNALYNGYTATMGNLLTSDELTTFSFAGQYIIYMQALRFITDYFNNDVYYKTDYETHNLVRACNQATLLKRYNEFVKKL